MHSNQQGHLGLYMLAMVSIFLGIACLATVIYTLPFVLLDVNYNVPTFVIYISNWYETHHNITGALLSALFFLPLILMAILFFAMAKIVDNYLETHHEPGLPDISSEEIEEHTHYDIYNDIQQQTVGVRRFHTIYFIIGLLFIALLLVMLAEYLFIINLFE